MRKAILKAAVIGTLMLGRTPYAHAQEATEMFIPVGQSPGLSGTGTLIGTIDEVNPRDRSITIVGASGSRHVGITDRTDVWLDRSKLHLPNQKGTFADCTSGLLAEVRYEDDDRKGEAPPRWIKIQLAGEAPQ